MEAKPGTRVPAPETLSQPSNDDIANMDEYDFWQMLAEARIV